MVVTAAAKSGPAVKKKKDTDSPGTRDRAALPDLDPLAEIDQEPAPTGFWKWQPQAEAFYQDLWVQIFVAGLIGGNFMCNIVEKQIDPKGDKFNNEFGVFELGFNVAFTIELVINMYASWFFRFWKSGWNIFDFIVVSIGVATTLKVPLPGPFRMLRMMRAFRVFRLFKRVESLNKIMVSLVRAVPGVMNAFLILLIVMSIYAILAVELFIDYGKDGSFKNKLGNVVNLTTSRGQDYGEEYFGQFSSSLYTMFQVLTGESWSEAVARPLVFGESWGKGFIALAFFCSFVLINGVVLINVVVAVLLDGFVESPAAGQEEVEEDEDEKEDEDLDGSEVAIQANIAQDLEKLSENMAQMSMCLDRLTQDMRDLKPQISFIMEHLQGQGIRSAAVVGHACQWTMSIWMFGLTKCVLFARLL